MKSRNLLYVFLLPTIILGLSSWFSGGSPGGKTGSPGDGANCTECHAGSPQTSSGWISSNIPLTGYVPGDTYTITATGTHSGVVKFGFELTAEDNSNSKMGTFIITNASQTQLANNNNATTHTPGGTTPLGNSKSWTFDWTAPNMGSGDITFYGAFNAANGNGNTSGDVIYLSNTTVMEAVTQQTDLTISFSDMTPHIGKMLEIRLINKEDLSEFARQKVDPIPSADFDVVFEDIVDGNSYYVDFYADHNDNGMYDMPPMDHAWRLNADDVMGGDVIPFIHNTNFVDIMWKHMLTFNLSSMTPHLGKLLEVRLKDVTMTYEETYRTRVESITNESFSIDMPALKPGHTYNIEFYADHNGNGVYDPIPTDHAWRIQTDMVEGDMVVDFVHNTNFTEIGWAYELTLELDSFTPHLGKTIMFRVTDTENGMEVSRFSRLVDLATINISLSGLEMGKTYNVDFFADHNSNGMYDPPPTDHAWRIETESITGNTTIAFSHNTSFTDINWLYMTTLHAMEMNPHLGQMFELRVYNVETFVDIGMVTIESIELTDFYINVPGAEMGAEYNFDFYADFNGNGEYNSPPVDHAWRLNVTELEGDTILPFIHNMNFTDILWPVSINENNILASSVNIYPNPFRNHLNIDLSKLESNVNNIQLYSSNGLLVKTININNVSNQVLIDTEGIKTGIYYLVIVLEDNTRIAKTIVNL